MTLRGKSILSERSSRAGLNDGEKRMKETAETTLTFTPSDTDDEMFRKIVSAFHLPDKPLKQYGNDLLLELDRKSVV